MKKKYIIGLVVLFLLMGGFLFYKFYILHKTYGLANHELNITLDTINVKTDRSFANRNVDGMNFQIREGINVEAPSKSPDTDKMMYYYKEDDIFHFSIFVYDNNFPSYSSDSNLKNVTKLAEKYNIKEKIDLVKYAKEHGDKKLNLLSSTSKMQMMHWAKFISGAIYDWDHVLFYEIEGDLDGWLCDSSGNQNIRFPEVELMNNGKLYYMQFNSRIYSLEDIKAFLNSVYFD